MRKEPKHRITLNGILKFYDGDCYLVERRQWNDPDNKGSAWEHVTIDGLMQEKAYSWQPSGKNALYPCETFSIRPQKNN